MTFGLYPSGVELAPVEGGDAEPCLEFVAAPSRVNPFPFACPFGGVFEPAGVLLLGVVIDEDED